MRLRSVCLVALVVLSGVVFAQSFTPVRELKNLTPAAIEKLHKLELLNALPAGEWRFHAGDLPHGEAVGLDDSKWELIAAPGERKSVKAPKTAAWYRRTIEVPKTLNGYDLTGARIWFQFRADANGPMPEIVYFNGRRVALGDDLEPIVMFEPAKPGDKVLVAVKLLATVDDKRWEGVRLRVETNAGETQRPNPDDVRIQIITAANLLPELPTPRRDLLPKVEEAVAAIDFAALDAADQGKFDASLEKAQGILDGLHGAMVTAKIDLAGNSHIDAAWLWPRSETIDVVKRTFTTALQLMNEYPNYTFTQSAAQYSAWMADKYPELNAQIKQRIKEGRWEIVGGMWVEPDLNLPGGESLVRQLLVGQREFQSLYGVTARIGWNPDSFGYNWQLPQIYKRSGMDYFVTQKMHWNDTNTLPFRLFWWESPDGSKVLTYFPTDYVHDNVNPTRISADFAESAQRNPGTNEMLDLYGIGDHGGGPTRDMLDQADHWIAASNAKAAVPAMRYGTAQRYFTDVEQHVGKDSPVWNYDRIAKGYTAPAAGANGAWGVPTWKDELYFEYHRGVFTTQAAHKRNMRVSETETLDAEKLASLAWLDGAAYPADVLTENWKKITFNQFHDLAAGSGIAVIYRDAQKDYTEVANADALIREASMKDIASRIDTESGGQGTPVLVSNTLPWTRNGIPTVEMELPRGMEGAQVRTGSGQPVRIQMLPAGPDGRPKAIVGAANVPAIGYTTLYVSSSKDAAALSGDQSRPDPLKRRLGDGYFSGLTGNEQSDGFMLRTFSKSGPLSVTIDKTNGCIRSITTGNAKDLLTGKSTLFSYLPQGACGNQLQAFADNPKNYDAWNIDPGTLDKAPTILDKVDSVKMVVDGPLRKTMRVERSWSKSHITQDISLDAGADTIVVDTTVDWHEDHVLLKVAFPLAATSGKATYEIPFGSIQRPTTRNNSWEKAQFEVPAQRWADLGDEKQGVSILNDSKYGYDAVGNTLRLTLLRSPTWPDPDADRGHQHFVYAIYPHVGSWKTAKTMERAYELNSPLTATQVFSHSGSLPATYSFASVDAPGVTLTAVKKAEDADALVFRMYEWAGEAKTVKLHVPPRASYAVESNLMEKVEGAHLPMTDGVVSLAIKPYEIRTVEVFYGRGGASAK